MDTGENGLERPGAHRGVSCLVLAANSVPLEEHGLVKPVGVGVRVCVCACVCVCVCACVCA